MHTLVLLDITVKEQQSKEKFALCGFFSISALLGGHLCERTVPSDAQGAQDLRTTSVHVDPTGSDTKVRRAPTILTLRVEPPYYALDKTAKHPFVQDSCDQAPSPCIFNTLHPIQYVILSIQTKHT
jgi:hypothetical protein